MKIGKCRNRQNSREDIQTVSIGPVIGEYLSVGGARLHGMNGLVVSRYWLLVLDCSFTASGGVGDTVSRVGI